MDSAEVFVQKMVAAFPEQEVTFAGDECTVSFGSDRAIGGKQTERRSTDDLIAWIRSKAAEAGWTA